jgi:hypothetical protein
MILLEFEPAISELEHDLNSTATGIDKLRILKLG